MTDEYKAKERVKILETYAEKAVRELEVGEAIDQCNEIRLMYHLRDIYKVQGAAEVLVEMLPEDEEARKLWRQANNMHKLGNNARDRFSRECRCEKASK